MAREKNVVRLEVCGGSLFEVELLIQAVHRHTSPRRGRLSPGDRVQGRVVLEGAGQLARGSIEEALGGECGVQPPFARLAHDEQQELMAVAGA